MNVYIAVISDGAGHTFCVYGTKDGLFYNRRDGEGNVVSEPTRLLTDFVDGIFRQNDSLFVVTPGPKLYNVSLTADGETIAVNLVFRTRQNRRQRIFGIYSSFIGGYYEAESDRLILGSSNAMIFVFTNNGGMDDRFDDKFRKWRAQKIKTKGLRNAQYGRMEQGSLLFYDVDTRHAVYIGSRYVMKVSMDTRTKESEFATMLDVQNWLDIGYDCHHLMYIYHQKTMVALQRLHASAARPFVLRIYTGSRLRFE